MKPLALMFLFSSCVIVAHGQAAQRAGACNTPSGNFTYHIDNRTVTFSNSVADATTWKWDFGDGNTSTSKEPTHTYPLDGNFNVCLTAFSDCSQALICNTISIKLVTGVNDAANDIVQLYPNVTYDQLHISFGEPLPQQVFITNLSGERLIAFSQATIRSRMDIDCSGFPSGMYVVSWTLAGTYQSRRFIKVN